MRGLGANIWRLQQVGFQALASLGLTSRCVRGVLRCTPHDGLDPDVPRSKDIVRLGNKPFGSRCSKVNQCLLTACMESSAGPLHRTKRTNDRRSSPDVRVPGAGRRPWTETGGPIPSTVHHPTCWSLDCCRCLLKALMCGQQPLSRPPSWAIKRPFERGQIASTG